MPSGLHDYHGRRVTVMGLGRFGGSLGAIRYLVQHGADVLVTDVRPAGALEPSLAQLADLGPIRLRLGEHRDEDFTDCDLVVASAAIPGDNRYLQQSRDRGIPVTREMNLFWERNPGRVVAITGTNGKSTTTALTHALLSRAFPERVWLGGNIGKSLLPDVEKIRPGDWVVLELSSFQLEDLAPLRPRPAVAMVTNFTPNHLDRHPSIEAYRSAKQQLLGSQTADQIAVLNQDDPDVAAWPTAARTFWFGGEDLGREGMFIVSSGTFPRHAIFRLGLREQVYPLGEWLQLPGRHNILNALAASATALALGAQAAHIEQGIREFAGLPHRLELVAERKGVRYYNDSKSTTPAATILAIRSFRAPTWLIVGGYDKQIAFDELFSEIAVRGLRGVTCIGQVGEQLASRMGEVVAQRRLSTTVRFCGSLAPAVEFIAGQAEAGDVVLLSPGCASYDQFENYEHRGEEFTRLIRELVDE